MNKPMPVTQNKTSAVPYPLSSTKLRVRIQAVMIVVGRPERHKRRKLIIRDKGMQELQQEKERGGR